MPHTLHFYLSFCVCLCELHANAAIVLCIYKHFKLSLALVSSPLFSVCLFPGLSIALPSFPPKQFHWTSLNSFYKTSKFPQPYQLPEIFILLKKEKEKKMTTEKTSTALSSRGYLFFIILDNTNNS